MNHRGYPVLGLVFACAVLSACGGGHGGSSIPSTVAKNGLSPKTAHATVTIKVPPKSEQFASASRRHAQYISPNTNSISISVNGSRTVVALSAANPNCTLNTGTLSCTIEIDVSPGVGVVFMVNTYASLNGTGPSLSTGTVVQTINSATNNPVNLTLNGIPVSAKLEAGNSQSGLPQSNPFVESSSVPASLTLVGGQIFSFIIDGIDASGATIISSSGAGVPSYVLLPGSSCSAAAPSPTSQSTTIGLSVAAIQVIQPFAACAYNISEADSNNNPIGTPLSSVTISALSALYLSQLGGTMIDIFDANGQKILVSQPSEPAGTQGQCTTFASSPQYNGIQQIAVQPPQSGASSDTLFLAATYSNNVAAIDDFCNFLQEPIALESVPSPYGAVYDAVNQDVYVGGITGLSAFSSGGSAAAGTFTPSPSFTPVPPSGGFAFDGLNGLAVATSGVIYATDSLDDALFKFNPSNPGSGQLVQIPIATTGEGALDEPVGVAFDSVNSRLYVVNQGTTVRPKAAITEYTTAGVFVAEFGMGTLGTPTGISYDPISGDLFVSDQSPVSINGNPGPGVVIFTPAGVDVAFPAAQSGVTGIQTAGTFTGVTVVP